MARMSIQQRNGHVGEAAVYKRLFEYGCSVNFLTQSDFGLDMHVQIPKLKKETWEPESFVPGKRSWELETRYAHVQAKFCRNDSWRPSEKDRELFAQWIFSSRFGLPTFVFIVGKDEDIFYIDPGTMTSNQNQYILTDLIGEKEPVTTRKREKWIELSGSEFILNTYLWTEYPTLMSELCIPAHPKDNCLEFFMRKLPPIVRGECIRDRIWVNDAQAINEICEEIFRNAFNRDMYREGYGEFPSDVAGLGVYADLDHPGDDNYYGWRGGEAVIIPEKEGRIMEGIQAAVKLYELRRRLL